MAGGTKWRVMHRQAREVVYRVYKYFRRRHGKRQMLHLKQLHCVAKCQVWRDNV
jgi:hypothetical protein